MTIFVMVALLVVQSSACGEGVVPWEQVSFGRLSTFNEEAVKFWAYDLSTHPDSGYELQLARGNKWACIVQIMEKLAAYDQRGDAIDPSIDPAGQGFEYARSHSGLRWTV